MLRHHSGRRGEKLYQRISAYVRNGFSQRTERRVHPGGGVNQRVREFESSGRGRERNAVGSDRSPIQQVQIRERWTADRLAETSMALGLTAILAAAADQPSP